MGDDSHVNLPPGFRFCPTDEELVLHFLFQKASHSPCQPNISIPDLDICLHDPWELNGKALSSGSLYYFFDKVTENRVTKNGYWKELDMEKSILSSAGKKMGIKKCLVFCTGEAPDGIETAWIMQEYHLCSSGMGGALYNREGRRAELDYDRWVLCRVHERKGDWAEYVCSGSSDEEDNVTELSSPDEMFLSTIDDNLDETSCFP